MRIIVISDSHRNSGVIDKIISAQPEATHLFFLGDNVADIEDYPILYPNIQFHVVSGNCDFSSTVPTSGIESINGVKIFYSHGHTLNVKYSTEAILNTAINLDCKLALFGHTHIPYISYANGVYLVNPGSCARPRGSGPSYGVIDITEKGIMPLIVSI